MTVECVANDTRRPLLALTAADIGLRENSEANLRSWFTLAAKWDAILLIDEADLFLERRRESDVDRNSLVTGRLASLLKSVKFVLILPLWLVFLRTMEYYQGVLFLVRCPCLRRFLLTNSRRQIDLDISTILLFRG